MLEWSLTYFSQLTSIFRDIQVVDKNSQCLNFENGLNVAYKIISNCATKSGKLIFIGNGASAAISSHQAVDYWKRARVKAVSFNDAPLLTCMGNDFGYEHVFSKPIEMFSDAEDILIAISSSGKSLNILNAVISARKKMRSIITLSGMSPNNPLRNSGDLNFYVPSSSYGHIEIIHVSILHCIVDYMAESLADCNQ